MRARRIVLIAAGVVVFLAISSVLARWLSAEGAERGQIEQAIRAEAAGNATGLVRALSGCAGRPACVAQARADAARLRRPGQVLILAYDSATAHALSSRTGLTRVAWKTPSTLPVVQCALVRRKGNAVSGMSVSLLRLSPPIRRTANCVTRR